MLPAALPQAVELRAVEQLAEDQRDLLLDDAGAVVLDADLEAVGAGLLDVDPDLGQDAGLFAGVERVVDRFLHRGEQRLARIVEAQQVAVLGEELAHRDVALLRRHALGRGAAAPAGLDDHVDVVALQLRPFDSCDASPLVLGSAETRSGSQGSLSGSAARFCAGLGRLLYA